MLRDRQLYILLVVLAVSACQPRAATTPVIPADSETTTRIALTATYTPPKPSLTLEPTATLSSDISFMERPSVDSVRVMSYNINWDSIFPDDDPKNHSYREFDLGDEFQRVMRAIKPDILCLQEVHHIRTHEELGEFLAVALDDDRRWQVANVRDTVIATHFNLIEEGYALYTLGIRPSMAQAAALVDLPDDRYSTSDLYLICAHFKASGGIGDIRERGRQADVIMRQVRDFKSPGEYIDLPPKTPFVFLGDFNIYDTDPALHLQTLLSGDIQFEINYGEDVIPDWDGTSLEEVLPSHNGMGVEFYTWREDASPFNPSALDRIIYSDSVLQVINAFILNTTLLSNEALGSLGLKRYDVIVDASTGFYDHLPIVVDFLIQPR